MYFIFILRQFHVINTNYKNIKKEKKSDYIKLCQSTQRVLHDSILLKQ